MFLNSTNNEVDETFEPNLAHDSLLKELTINLGYDEESLTELEEKKTIVRLNKDAKINLLKSGAARLIAKEKKDPMFAKMIFHRRKYLQFKDAINRKYDALALKRAKSAFKTGRLTTAVDLDKNAGKSVL